MNGQPDWGGRSLAEAVREAYRQGQTDYAIEPLVRVEGGLPAGRIGDGDAVVFCCRRGEREVQLTEAFTDPDFPHFPRADFNDLNFVILTLYHEKFKDLHVAFAPARLRETLGETASRAGLRQLRLSESEKFAHVTFFFNGGSRARLPGEDDWCVPSPRGIPAEQAPQLSLAEVAQKVGEGLEQQYDLIVVNFANGDVVGHTTDCAAKIRCAEIVDRHLENITRAAQAAGYVTMITADHGNLEEMIHPDGSPHVSHTTNPVPFILIDPLQVGNTALRQGGTLACIAPTILDALNIQPPGGMNGLSLAPCHAWHGRRRVLLVILDGWGIGREDDSNPIHLALTPCWRELLRRFPSTYLDASGEAVGLQPGKAGNSEAGHMNIGAGRMVPQDDARLDQAMRDGTFFTNEILCSAIRQAKEKHRALHLICLLTEKSSHGSIEYPLALLRMAKIEGLEKVYLHVIFDGRSTEPGSAPALLEKLDRQVEAIGVGEIVTGVGRGIALDRDGNYSKTRKAYDALVWGAGKPYGAG